MAAITEEPDKAPAKWVLGFLVAGVASIVFSSHLDLVRGLFSGDSEKSQWIDLKTQRLDPNTATLAELELIPGLGRKLAGELIRAREENRFQGIEDVGKIKGFGPKKLALIDPWLKFPSENILEKRQLQGLLQLKHNDQSNVPSPNANPRLVDPNTATANDLERIPGIGPKMAKNIVATREQRPFESVEDLMRVPGIGSKNIEKFRPYLKFKP
jgi:competence ComEA-like helix-hairpin-helix protein